MPCYNLVLVYKLDNPDIDFTVYVHELNSRGLFYSSICTEVTGYIALEFKSIYASSQSEAVNFITDELSTVDSNIELVSLISDFSSDLITLNESHWSLHPKH
jgi:hypothetical protein